MAKIRYERMACRRCGGSGRYSYCAMYGDMCFGCGGSGKVRTDAGTRAKAEIADLRMKLYGQPASAFKVGDTILLDGYWRVLTESRPEPHRGGTPYPGGGWYFRTAAGGRIGDAATVYARRPTAAEWARVIEHARTLDGATVIETAAARS